MGLTGLQETIANDPLLVIAPLIAIGATLFLTYAPNNLGKDTTFWRAVRNLLPYIDEQAKELGFYSTYPVPDTEIVGYWHGDINMLYKALRQEGFVLSPLAAHKDLKLDESLEEVASFAHFGKDMGRMEGFERVVWKLTRRHQLHVTVFEAPADVEHDYIITAHYEKNAYSPLTAYQHLKGKGLDVEKGRVMADNKLEGRAGYERVA